MESLILYIFKLILRIFYKFILDSFYKSLRIVTILAKEGLKFFLEYDNIWLFILNVLAFILYSVSTNLVIKKKVAYRIQLSLLA